MTKEIKWVDDEAAIVVLGDMGMAVEDRTILVRDVNKKASRENRARDLPLDETRVGGIKNAIEKGVPMPKIVMREVGGQYVIAGGNHRFASVNGVQELPVHVLADCSDVEFEVACRILNTVVGEGMTQQQRVSSAVDAVERLGFSRKDACELYGVTEDSVKHGIASVAAQRRLASMPPRVRNALKKTHITRLGELANNENILRAAANLVAETKISADELGEIAKVVRGKTTEAAQVLVFEDRMKMGQSQSTRKVPRKTRQKLLSALTTIQQLKGKKTWASVEVTKDEVEIFRQNAKDVISILSCLLKVDG
jgi:hypothetical protein